MTWKPIANFEGYYEVSDAGTIRSVERVIVNSNGVKYRWKSRNMKLTRGKAHGSDGYYVVNLHKDGISHVMLVHTIVATAYIPNPQNFPTVNHIDGDKTNNCVHNLEWASYSKNNIHALQTGLRRSRGTQVAQYCNGVQIGVYHSVQEAARKTGISYGMISHCVNGRAKQAGGFVWQKISEGLTTIVREYVG